MSAPRQVVLIVGGGLAGSLVAAHLLRASRDIEVVVAEPRDRIGPGLAYSTADEHHLMNVPAHVLGVDPADTGGFLAWLDATERPTPPDAFVPRRWYGDYLAARFDDARGSTDEARLRHVHAHVVALQPADRGWIADTTTGERIEADAVVLALGSPTGPTATLPGEFASPWEPDALAPLDGGTALLVGTGLTAVDAALSLTADDPDARVVAVSSRALLPHRHATTRSATPAIAPTWPDAGPRTADELAAGFERAVADTRDSGGDWRGIVDLLRPDIPTLWSNLDTDEQRRFLREHARCWELHRHRMAPQVAARVDELRASGRLELVAARVEAAPQPRSDGRLRVELAEVEPDSTAHRDVDRVLWCTGVDRDIRTTRHPLLRSLLDAGSVASDPHGLGVRATPAGAVLDAAGTPHDSLFVLGHLRRGELYESTAVVEIRDQSATVADEIASQLVR